MSDYHPSEATLGRFFRFELDGRTQRAVVRHLLGGCQRCVEAAQAAWRREVALRGQRTDEGSAGPLDKPLVIAKRLHAAVDRERREAVSLLEELASHPASRQTLLVCNSRRFHTPAVCSLVLQRAVQLGFEDPREALATAELGREIADRLDTGRYPAPLARDLQARAWATVANARRIGSELGRAESDFEHAEELLEKGTGDPLETGQLLTHKAFLRNAQRRFPEARRLFDRAIACYRRAGDTHLVARTRINRGSVRGEAGELEAAIEDLRRGLESLDVEREPRMALVAKHNLILFLHESGQTAEADHLLPEARALHSRLGNSVDVARLQWLEAKLDVARDHLTEAEETLIEVIDAFVEREMPYPAANAAIDLAAVYLRQGRAVEIGRLVGEILPIFRSLRIGREAVAAIALLARAAEQRRLTAELLVEVRNSVTASSRKPPARPRPASG